MAHPRLHRSVCCGRYEDAETNYRKALNIKLEFSDRYEAAISYHQLGMLAQEQRRIAEAEASYRKALDIYLEFGDRHGAAEAPTISSACARAGAAAVLRKLRPATARPSTSTWSSVTEHGAASTYQQLGMVAQEQGRFAEAEASYRQALDIYLEFGDRH